MNTIDKLQDELSTWYETSSVGQFLRWWIAELKSFVPEKHQEKLFPRAVKVYLVHSDEDIVVWCKNGTVFEKYSGSENEHGEKEQWWHQLQHIVNQADGKKVEVQFLLPNDHALVRKIALPGAAKENLDEVIGFELDKYVPFNSEQVQLSYKIDKQKSNESKILIDLAVVPKQKVTDVLNLCDEKSILLDGIDVNLKGSGMEPQYLGVNLLPRDKRKAKDYFNLQLNLGLLLLLFGLIYFVMYTSLDNKQIKIERLTEINSQLQKQARMSKLLRKELKEVIVSSKFLQNRKKEHPPLVATFSEVTSILPDHTYITRLKIGQESLEITGQSDNANSLVPKLDKSPLWFVPHVVGGIVPDPRTGKEKFTIKADLHESHEEEENGKS